MGHPQLSFLLSDYGWCLGLLLVVPEPHTEPPHPGECAVQEHAVPGGAEPPPAGVCVSWS